jgi:hypothetical protein
MDLPVMQILILSCVPTYTPLSALSKSMKSGAATAK